MGIGQEHRQPVYAYANAAGRWHSIRECPDVVFVHLVSLFVAALAFLELLFETAALVFGIVEFAEAVGNFHLPGEDLPALGPIGLVRLLLGERRDRGGKLVNDRRLN